MRHTLSSLLYRGILVLACASISLLSCKKKEKDPPANPGPSPCSNCPVGSVYKRNNDSTFHFKKVLLEDYTGHQCGNCPAAADVAKVLLSRYQDSLVVLAVHAGFFSRTNTQFPNSYTTTTGNDWDGTAGFGVSQLGNPNGMVNRKAYPGIPRVHAEGGWPSSVAIAMKDSLPVLLRVNTSYHTVQRSLDVSVKAIFKKNYNSSVNLTVVLTEDSIIGPQTDYRVNSELVPNYQFDHMLRGAVNGSWGQLLKSTPIVANDIVSITLNGLKVDSTFNDRNISLVLFASDQNTRTVLQVEKLKIR